ncbi:hypothetical protein WK56_23640 [Burkholderia ubonensis]|nr:hypothetical protein WK56_23640 [Burkholderia ubonensis]
MPPEVDEATGPPTLPTEPQGAHYDADLELICRIAAQVGADEHTPINYTSLLVAFHIADESDVRPITPWFKHFTGDTGVDIEAMFREAHAEEARFGDYVAAAKRGYSLPMKEPLYSDSARRLFANALDIAELVATSPESGISLGARHLMAAFALRSPSEHLDQVRRWRLDPDTWAGSFLYIAGNPTDPASEDWGRLTTDLARTRTQLISTFTSDDPMAPRHDVLGIDDEAAAFARIAAAESVKPPLAIGIFGEWGSGKTFFMRRIHDNVSALSADSGRRKKETGTSGPFLPDIVQIRFNAWHYIETNLWASLVEYVFAELDGWLQQQAGASTKTDAEFIFNRLATARQLKLDALDEVVTRRTERRNAELRADLARRAYEEAVVRAAEVGPGTYARALVETILEDKELKESVAKFGNAIGAPDLADSTGRVIEILEQARSESGRVKLTWRASAARLGTVCGILTVIVVLFVIPNIVLGLRDFLSGFQHLQWLKQANDAVLAASGLLTSLAATGGLLLRQARAAISEIDKFDKTLDTKVQEKIEAANRGLAADKKKQADEDLAKRKQAVEAAERALAEAEAKLNTARSDFEAATARSRLNAFIRSKAAGGDYAKHLGIIAAIRRDFGQLANLIGSVKEVNKTELAGLEDQSHAAVVRFLDRLISEQDAKLTASELQSLLMLIEPGTAVALLAKRKEQLNGIVDDPAKLTEIEAQFNELQHAKTPTLSRIVLYIDDLDRCGTDVVVKVLEAVHLLLCFPLFMVVVAVDARWVSRALHERFPKLLEKGAFSMGEKNHGDSEGATSLDYLEKIFQLPYWVRAVDSAGARRYVSSLVEDDVRHSEAAERPILRSQATDSLSRGSAATDSIRPTKSSPEILPVSTPESRRLAKAFTAPLTAAAVGLEITLPEASALERFAPLISPTPRRLLRFVNLYRLLKTALQKDVRERMFGEGGAYRALIVQLAIVTAAPEAAPSYFAHLASLGSGTNFQSLLDALIADDNFKSKDAELVLDVLRLAAEWGDPQLTVDTLQQYSEMARRYSFTAWNL